MICKSLHLWKHTTSWSLTADTQLTNQHFFIPTITIIVNKASTHRISHCLAVGGAARSSTKHPKMKSVVSLGKSVVSPGKSVVSKNVNFWKKHILKLEVTLPSRNVISNFDPKRLSLFFDSYEMESNLMRCFHNCFQKIILNSFGISRLDGDVFSKGVVRYTPGSASGEPIWDCFKKQPQDPRSYKHQLINGHHSGGILKNSDFLKYLITSPSSASAQSLQGMLP